MWTVPWSLETQMREASWLKLILQRRQTAAGFLLGQTVLLLPPPRAALG